MDSEKRPKRPRIGSIQASGNEDATRENHYERVNYPYRQGGNDYPGNQ